MVSNAARTSIGAWVLTWAASRAAVLNCSGQMGHGFRIPAEVDPDGGLEAALDGGRWECPEAGREDGREGWREGSLEVSRDVGSEFGWREIGLLGWSPAVVCVLYNTAALVTRYVTYR